jgi:MoaA/NifB/PqqE/SkfB family radical SAM enzyme
LSNIFLVPADGFEPTLPVPQTGVLTNNTKQAYIFFKYLMIEKKDIKQVQVELSSICNADCPLCARNKWGWGKRTDFIERNMTLAECQHIFADPELSLEQIQLCGSFGDPLCNKQLLAILHFFNDRFAEVNLSIHTNGGLRDRIFFKKLAEFSNLHVNFGIDGLEDTNHLYRRNVNFQKVMANAEAYIQAGGTAIWNFIPFKHNEHQLLEIEKLSKQMQFKELVVHDKGRDYAWLHDEKRWILPAGEFKGSDKEFENITILDEESFEKLSENPLDLKILQLMYKKDPHLNCLTKQKKNVYIDSRGNLWPCCYIGLDPRKFNSSNNSQLLPLLHDQEINLLQVSWQQAMQWWYKIEQSWNYKTIQDGLLKVCIRNCNKIRKK